MINARMYRALGISIPVVTVLVLFGITETLFNVGIQTNLFKTGVTPATLLGLANIFLAWSLYKNHI